MVSAGWLKMSERSIRERVTNNLLLLYLIDKTNQIGQLEDALKLQKLVFLAQKRLVDRKLKAYSYNFFRWQKGPYSADLSNDLNMLVNMGFVIWRRNNIELTEQGKKILNACDDVFVENKTFLRHINLIIEEYATLDPEVIKDLVYDMKVMVPKIRKLMLIKQIPMKQLILFKSSDKKVRLIFHISKDWSATLELTFDEEALDSLKQAQRDAIEGKVHEVKV